MQKYDIRKLFIDNLIEEAGKDYFPTNLESITLQVHDSEAPAGTYMVGTIPFEIESVPDLGQRVKLLVKFSGVPQYNITPLFSKDVMYSVTNLESGFYSSFEKFKESSTYVNGMENATRINESGALAVNYAIIRSVMRVYRGIPAFNRLRDYPKYIEHLIVNNKKYVYTLDKDWGYSQVSSLTNPNNNGSAPQTFEYATDALRGIIMGENILGRGYWALFTVATISSIYYDADLCTRITEDDIYETAADTLAPFRDFATVQRSGRRLAMRKETLEKFNIPYKVCPISGVGYMVRGEAYYSRSPYMRREQSFLVDRGVHPIIVEDVLESVECRECGHQEYYLSERFQNLADENELAGEYFDELRENYNAMTEPYMMHENRYGRLICDSCYEENYFDYTQIRLSGFNFDTTRSVASYNGKDYSVDDDYYIGSYDYKPDFQMFGDRQDLHLGAEIEIDQGGENDSKASILNAVLGYEFAYSMHDGSLNDGFELATMPATLKYHLEDKSGDYENFFNMAVGLGYRAHDVNSCGLHIHFDRSFLGADSRTANLKAAYIAIIMEKNWDEFVNFSRRNYSRMEDWSKKKDLINYIDEEETTDTLVDKFRYRYDDDKYVALNTNHRNSYELRIFRGTLKKETYFATLQFVDNLVRLAKSTDSLAKAQQIKFKDIIDYNPTEVLVEYCKERNLL